MTEKSKAHRIHPFSCGSQYADWIHNNCKNGCPKTYDYKLEDWRCPLMKALDIAYISDGTVPQWVAKAIGFYDKRDWYVWHCNRRMKYEAKRK